MTLGVTQLKTGIEQGHGTQPNRSGMKDLWPSASRFWHLIKPGSETVNNPDPDSFRPQGQRSRTQKSKSAGDDRDRIIWTGPKGPDRQNLVARISYDEGQTWPVQRMISAGPSAYSDLTILKDRSVGVLWERGVAHGYQFVTFTRLTREFLEPRRRILQRWIRAPDYPYRSAGTGLTSLKHKQMLFENIYHSMPFACASGLLQATRTSDSTAGRTDLSREVSRGGGHSHDAYFRTNHCLTTCVSTQYPVRIATSQGK